VKQEPIVKQEPVVEPIADSYDEYSDSEESYSPTSPRAPRALRDTQKKARVGAWIIDAIKRVKKHAVKRAGGVVKPNKESPASSESEARLVVDEQVQKYEAISEVDGDEEKFEVESCNEQAERDAEQVESDDEQGESDAEQGESDAEQDESDDEHAESEDEQTASENEAAVDAESRRILSARVDEMGGNEKTINTAPSTHALIKRIDELTKSLDDRDKERELLCNQHELSIKRYREHEKKLNEALENTNDQLGKLRISKDKQYEIMARKLTLHFEVIIAKHKNEYEKQQRQRIAQVARFEKKIDECDTEIARLNNMLSRPWCKPIEPTIELTRSTIPHDLVRRVLHKTPLTSSPVVSALSPVVSTCAPPKPSMNGRFLCLPTTPRINSTQLPTPASQSVYPAHPIPSSQSTLPTQQPVQQVSQQRPIVQVLTFVQQPQVHLVVQTSNTTQHTRAFPAVIQQQQIGVPQPAPRLYQFLKFVALYVPVSLPVLSNPVQSAQLPQPNMTSSSQMPVDNVSQGSHKQPGLKRKTSSLTSSSDSKQAKLD
jgi:hypothetical protein